VKFLRVLLKSVLGSDLNNFSKVVAILFAETSNFTTDCSRLLDKLFTDLVKLLVLMPLLNWLFRLFISSEMLLIDSVIAFV